MSGCVQDLYQMRSHVQIVSSWEAILQRALGI